MKALITVGCKTDHGGIIVLGDSSFLVEGKAVHLDGMTHFCPKCKVQSRAIASNQGFMVVGEKALLLLVIPLSCGSKYLKISDLAVMSSGASSPKIVSNNTNSFVAEPNFKYGQKFVLQDELTGEPLANVCYEIYMNGETFHGKTDKEGFTHFITSETEEELEIRIILEDHEHGE